MKTLILVLMLTIAAIGAASKFLSHEEPPAPIGITPHGGGRLGEGKLER